MIATRGRAAMLAAAVHQVRPLVENLEARTFLTAIPITYMVEDSGAATRQVSLAVYDAGGVQVRTLLAGEEQTPGSHTINWDGLNRNGQVVGNGNYTWKLLVNDGLTAEYVTQLGVNPPGESYGFWVGNQNAAQAVAVDEFGSIYIGAGLSENVPEFVKLSPDGSQILWRKLQYVASGGAADLAVAGDAMYVLQYDNRVQQANAGSAGLEKTIDLLWNGDTRPDVIGDDSRIRIDALPASVGPVIYRNTFDAFGANIGLGTVAPYIDQTTGTAFLNKIATAGGTLSDASFLPGTDSNLGGAAASGQILRFEMPSEFHGVRTDILAGASTHFRSAVNAINALPAGTYTITFELDAAMLSAEPLGAMALVFWGSNPLDSGGDKRWTTGTSSLPMGMADGHTFQHYRRVCEFTLVDNPTTQLPEGSFARGQFAGFDLDITLDARKALSLDSYWLEIDNLTMTQPVTQGVENALVASYADHDAVRWISPYSSNVLAEVTLTEPGDVAVGPNGLVYVISEGAVLGITPQTSPTNPPTVIVPASSLSSPYRLDYDSATGQLWVAEGVGSEQVKSFDILMLNYNLNAQGQSADQTDAAAFLSVKQGEIGSTTLTEQQWGGSDSNTGGAEAGGMSAAFGAPAGSYVIRSDMLVTAGPHFQSVVDQINGLPAGTYDLTITFDYANSLSGVPADRSQMQLSFFSSRPQDSGGNARYETGWQLLGSTGSSNTFTHFSKTYTFTLVSNPSGTLPEGQFAVGQFVGFDLDVQVDARTRTTAGTVRLDNLTMRSTNVGGGGLLYRNTWDDAGSDLGNLASSLAQTYGRAGGRLYGSYDPEDFREITAIAGDGKGGFVLTEGGEGGQGSSLPRTASIGAMGQVQDQWFGGQAFYSCSAADPDDPQRVYFTAGWNAIAVAEVDYTTGNWEIVEEYKLPAFGDGLFPVAVSTSCPAWTVRHANGQTYLETALKGPAVLRVDQLGGTLVPVARAGNETTRSNPYWIAAVQAIDQNPATYATAYSWTDLDADGVMDPAEFTLGGSYSSNPSTKGFLDADWNYYIPYDTDGNGGGVDDAWYVLPNEGDPGELPQWNWANAAGSPGELPAEFNDAGRYYPVSVYEGSTGAVYQLVSGQKNPTDDRHGAAWPANYSGIERLVKWNQQGQLLWSVGRHAIGSMIRNGIDPAFVTPPEQIHASVKVMGEVAVPNEIEAAVVIQDKVMRPASVWSSDGLYAGSFLDNRADDGLPDSVYSWFMDAATQTTSPIPYDDSQGHIAMLPGGDVLWFPQGNQGTPIYKISGWGDWDRDDGTVSMSAPADHTLREGQGLHGEYFNNQTLSGEPSLARDDSRLWFGPGGIADWSTNSPGAGVSADFSARWTGQIEPHVGTGQSESSVGEQWIFSVYADHNAKVKLWVDGNLIIDEWNTAPTTGNPPPDHKYASTVPMQLCAGQQYDVVLEYADPSGNASVSLNWESFSQDRQRIPTTQLYLPGQGLMSQQGDDLLFVEDPVAVPDKPVAHGRPYAKAAALPQGVFAGVQLPFSEEAFSSSDGDWLLGQEADVLQYASDMLA